MLQNNSKKSGFCTRMSNSPSFSGLCGLFLKLSWPRMRITAMPSSGKWWKISSRQKMPSLPAILRPMRYTHRICRFMEDLSAPPANRTVVSSCTETLHRVWRCHAHCHVKEHHLQPGVPKRPRAALPLLHQTRQGWCLQAKATLPSRVLHAHRKGFCRRSSRVTKFGRGKVQCFRLFLL